MKNLLIENTPTTPKISFKDGVLSIEGRSISDDSQRFYLPLTDAVSQYTNAPKPLTVIKINFSYFNTSASKVLLNIFKSFEKIYKAGEKVEVKWHYDLDDEEMFEYGKDYEAIIKLPFEFIENK